MPVCFITDQTKPNNRHCKLCYNMSEDCACGSLHVEDRQLYEAGNKECVMSMSGPTGIVKQT